MKSIAKTLLLIFSFVVATSTIEAFTFVSKPVSSTSATQLQMTVLSNAAGKKVDVKEGTPLKNAVSKLGVKPKYSCRKGDCGSCSITVGGSRIKACVGKVPPAPRLKSLQEKGLLVK